MAVAALQHNASKAVGLDGALRELALQPFGQLLLGIVALGLIAYGALLLRGSTLSPYWLVNLH